MSGPTGAAPPKAVLSSGLDLGGPWHQRGAWPSSASVQVYPLASAVRPPPAAGGGWGARRCLRLPSIGAAAKGPRRRGSMARLSLSEPSLLHPNDTALFEGFPSTRRPPVPPPVTRSSVPLPCKICHPPRTSQPHQQVHRCSRAAFLHFSQAIQPSSKPRPVRRLPHNPVLTADAEQAELQPAAARCPSPSFQGEPLSVVGKPCLLSCSPRPAASRTQLHVFLPTEGKAEEADTESVDEGFMDELDWKAVCLKLQPGAPRTVTYH